MPFNSDPCSYSPIEIVDPSQPLDDGLRYLYYDEINAKPKLLSGLEPPSDYGFGFFYVINGVYAPSTESSRASCYTSFSPPMKALAVRNCLPL